MATIPGISNVFVDRAKALEFWLYSFAGYGQEPDEDQISEMTADFEDAERTGEVYEQEGACIQVVEVST